MLTKKEENRRSTATIPTHQQECNTTKKRKANVNTNSHANVELTILGKQEELRDMLRYVAEKHSKVSSSEAHPLT